MLHQELGHAWSSACCLAGLAGVAAIEGQPARAVRLFAAATALYDATPTSGTLVIEPANPAEWDRSVQALRAQLDAATFMGAWTEGRAMPLHQAIADALADQDRSAAGATANDRLDSDQSAKLRLERGI